MKRNIKSAVAILLCLTVILAACGCSGATPESVVKDYEDTEQVTLSVFTGSMLMDNIWNAGFTASDGTQIKIVEYTSDYYEQTGLTYREMVLKRLQSNVDIDCYVIHAEDVIAFSDKNYWMDLHDLAAVDSLSEDALKQSIYDGKVFSIPFAYTGFGFYWNVNMLQEHGLSVPSNIEEFLHVCETLKQAGITPYLANKGFALTVPAMAMGFADLYAAPNSEQLLMDLASGKTPVSTYMQDGFAFIEMMIQKGYLDPVQALDTAPGTADLEGFLAGKGAFFCGTLKYIKTPDFEIAMTGIPTPKAGTVAVVGAEYRLAVNPNSPNKSYAVELLNTMITPEWLAGIAAGEQALSSGKGDYDISYLHEEYRDFAKLVQKGNQIPNQDFSLTFNTWEAIRDICREICAGETAAYAAEKYDQIQQEQIAAYRK